MRLHVPIKLRWSDLDAYGHVNNAEMLRLLEEARIEAFWVTDDSAGSGEAVGGSTAVLDGRPGADTLTLIARQEIEYLAPIPYLRQPLDVRTRYGSDSQQARDDLTAIVSQRNNLVRDYNAASEKFNWSPFQTRADMPPTTFTETAAP